MFKKIYIYCPTTQTATGGTELLHQLSYKLTMFHCENYLIYNGIYENSPIQKAFSKYNCSVASSVDDSRDNLLIVPETGIKFLYSFKNIKKSIWWESVDNYTGSRKQKTDFLRYLRNTYRFLHDRKNFKNIIHFVQSQYAREWLETYWDVKQELIISLSDYLSDAFINNAITSNIKKNDIVFYNPKKGFEFTTKIIQAMPKTSFVPIKNMTSDQVANLMLEGKIYIDFGNHPGKDRMPREAAISKCIIITGKMGAAANSVDIPIDEKYKIPSKDENIFDIVKLIKQSLINYECYVNDFAVYRSLIMKEEEEFEKQIFSFFVK